MDPINPVTENPSTPDQTLVSQSPKIKNSLVLIMSVLLIITVVIAGVFYFQIQRLSKELSKYQSAVPTPSATPKERVFCKDPRPQVCTYECIVNPPYICGSDGKSYCTTCQACSNPKVEWYRISSYPCE